MTGFGRSTLSRRHRDKEERSDEPTDGADDEISSPVVGHDRGDIVREPGAVERDPDRYRRRRRLVEVGLATGIPVALILLWQVTSATGIIDARLYPEPSKIVGAAADLWSEGEVRHDVFVTVKRVLLGWTIGTVLGVGLGVLMGVSRYVRKALEPTLDALYVVPKLALLPVLLNLFGLGEAPIIALVAVTVFFFVWISTMSAVVSVPEGFLETAAAFQANRAQTLRHVVLPAALPQTLTGMRVAAGVAVLVIVAAEHIAANDGLGYLIFHSRDLFQNDRMYVGILIIAAFGVLLAQIIRLVGRRLVPWDSSDDLDRASVS